MRRLPVTIPSGVNVRTLLRVHGGGDAGKAGGSPGDLLLRFWVRTWGEG